MNDTSFERARQTWKDVTACDPPCRWIERLFLTTLQLQVLRDDMNAYNEYIKKKTQEQ
jgi:hypothetical protein